MAVTWLQGQIAIRAGGLLKERLLYGALRLEPDDIRRHGAGQLLGRVIETEAMESLALGGGFLSLESGIELVVAMLVAAFGAGSVLIPALLLLWSLLTGGLLAQYFNRCSRWARTRLAMTDDLVERMVGHRTRLAQEPKEDWHEREDQSLEAYQAISSRMDRSVPWLTALLPRGWLAVGIAGIAPGFVAGSVSPEGLAIRLGAILLAFRAFRKLGVGAPQLLQAVIAWKQAQPLLVAAQRAEPRGLPSLACAMDKPRPGDVLVEARDVVFHYDDRQEPVLRGCAFQIRAGDRILLDGPSGEGKSTLAAVVAGVRKPTSGLVLAGGLDRTSLGAQGWRRRVAVAPQFHENHMITGPLAFNLLMGKSGAIADADLREAETVCKELGLGELLQRMPAGIMQMVGESGWQLSHGERSRVYLARALLQKAELVLLDESLAALDTGNLRRAIACIEKRATAVLAIAHR
jgi:ATP-binding cassette subfamily B protein